MSLSQIGVINSFQNVEKACFRLPFRGNYLVSTITVGQGWNPCRLGGLELSDCRFQFILKTCLSIGEATLESLWVEALIPTIQRGNRNPPLKANLSALSFRLHKKGRARRGMSDKVKIIYNLIDVLNCNQHSYNPSVFLLRKNPPAVGGGPLCHFVISPHTVGSHPYKYGR